MRRAGRPAGRGWVPRGCAAAAVAAWLCAGAGLAAQPAALRVIASNGVRTLVEALAPAFERSSGRRLQITYGTSSGLRTGILAGDVFDVLIASADAVDDLARSGQVVPGTRTGIGRSVVGVGVRAGAPPAAIRTTAELTQVLLDARAVAYAADGASRPHIEAMFVRLGIADAVKPKAILEQGSARAMGRVLSGDADVVLTLVSEILPVQGMALAGALPAEFSSSVSFAAGVGAGAGDGQAARALVAFLTSAEARQALAAKGLEYP